MSSGPDWQPEIFLISLRLEIYAGQLNLDGTAKETVWSEYDK